MDSNHSLEIYGLVNSEQFHIAVHCAEVIYLCFYNYFLIFVLVFYILLLLSFDMMYAVLIVIFVVAFTCDCIIKSTVEVFKKC